MRLAFAAVALLVSGCVFSSCVFSGCVSAQERIFGSLDTRKQLKQSLFANYDKYLAPFNSSNRPMKVHVDFHLVAIQSINAKEQTMSVEGWMELLWPDHRLQWDPQQYSSVDMMVMPVKQLWTPDVTLLNSAVGTEIETMDSRKTMNAMVRANGDVFWIPSTSLKALCDVDMTYYPYDTHTCSLKYVSWIYDTEFVELMPLRPNQPPSVSEMMKHNEWKVMSTSINQTITRYSTYPLPYSTVYVTYTLRRQASFSYTALLFPVVSTVIMAVVAFVMHPVSRRRFMLNAFNLLINVLNLIYMQQQHLPVTGNKTPCIVLMSEGMTLLLPLAMLWGCITRALTTRLKGSQPPRMLHTMVNSWPTKVLMTTQGNSYAQLQEACKRACELGQSEKSPEMMTTMDEDKRHAMASGWMAVFTFLDRLAFVTFVVISVALIAIFAR